MLCCQEATKACQIDNFLDAERVKPFEVVPDDILNGVAVVRGVELNHTLAEERVEDVEILFTKTAVEEDANDVSLLSLLEIEAVQLLEGLQVVL